MNLPQSLEQSYERMSTATADKSTVKLFHDRHINFKPTTRTILVNDLKNKTKQKQIGIGCFNPTRLRRILILRKDARDFMTIGPT